MPPINHKAGIHRNNRTGPPADVTLAASCGGCDVPGRGPGAYTLTVASTASRRASRRASGIVAELADSGLRGWGRHEPHWAARGEYVGAGRAVIPACSAHPRG